MASDRFRRMIINNVKTQIQKSLDWSDEKHPGSKGSVRENCVRDLIEPVLRSGVDANANGHVIDCKNNQSGQVDVIVFADSVLPRVLRDSPDYVPLESTLYLFEVKSKATRTGIREAIQKARTIRALSMEPGAWGYPDFIARDPLYNYQPGMPVFHASKMLIQGISPVFVFFAFSSDMKDGDELDRFMSAFTEEGVTERDLSNPPIAALCIVGKGYWFHKEGTTSWEYRPASPEYDEVVDLLAGISNSIPQILISRGAPKLGPYFMLGNREGCKQVHVRIEGPAPPRGGPAVQPPQPPPTTTPPSPPSDK